MTVLIETSADRWTRMIRATGVVGLVTIVVLFAGVASAPGEPFTASPQEALAFFISTPLRAGAGRWWRLWQRSVDLFVVGLCSLLGRAEGSPPWRSAVALVRGNLAAMGLLNTSGNAAAFGAADLDLVASYAFRVTSLGFANICSPSVGLRRSPAVVLSTRVVGRWLGWWGIASGLGFVVARFFWTSEFWLRRTLPSGSG